MFMDKKYSQEQIIRIRDQALTYQCACPAQVCVAIDTIRHLHAYQAKCLNSNKTDHAVHQRISESAAKTHADLENCLTDILRLEGWDMETLTIPDFLKKRLLEDL
jgi:hypothetical protein